MLKKYSRQNNEIDMLTTAKYFVKKIISMIYIYRFQMYVLIMHITFNNYIVNQIRLIVVILFYNNV